MITKDFNVDLIVNAPDYQTPSGMSNDIALVRLAEDADLSVYTPACLPAADQDYTGQNSTVAGWGARYDGRDDVGGNGDIATECTTDFSSLSPDKSV